LGRWPGLATARDGNEGLGESSSKKSTSEVERFKCGFVTPRGGKVTSLVRGEVAILSFDDIALRGDSVQKPKSYDQESGGRIRRWTQEFPKVRRRDGFFEKHIQSKMEKKKTNIGCRKGL